jgi:hypothetical protein
VKTDISHSSEATRNGSSEHIIGSEDEYKCIANDAKNGSSRQM